MLKFAIVMLLELATECSEKRVCWINGITSQNKFLQFKEQRKVVFDVEIEGFFFWVEHLKTTHSALLIHM